MPEYQRKVQFFEHSQLPVHIRETGSIRIFSDHRRQKVNYPKIFIPFYNAICLI